MRLLWLSQDESKVRLRSEQVLATARAALAGGALIASYLDPTEPAHHAEIVDGALWLYTLTSLAILIPVRSVKRLPSSVSHVLFAVDVTFAGLVTLFTAGTSSPFFVFFWFVLLAAAFRHGLGGAIRTAALLILIMIGQLVLLPYIDQTSTPEVNLLVARSTYLLVMAFLVGYFAQKEKDLRTEAVVVARSLGRARGERSFSRGMHAALDELGGVFDAQRAILALRAADGTRHCWQWERASTSTGRARVQALISGPQDYFFYPMSPDVNVWHAVRGRERAVAALDMSGERTRLPQLPPDSLWDALQAESVVGVCATLSDGSQARLFIPDPSRTTASSFMLHLMHVVTMQLVPTLHNLSLLESETAAVERSRLARELHDRVLQSLIGVEMQLAVMQRSDLVSERLRGHVRDVHEVLKGEIANVRDLMQDLRPIELRCEEVPQSLANLVDRFQSETGIRAVLRCEVETVGLTPRQCGDLVRVVQEALVNVRKHSGATHVVVRLEPGAGGLTLSIEDDGCGFGFEGRLLEEQLWSERCGPRVIKERARAIGGALSIESHPGRGARVNLNIPYAI